MHTNITSTLLYRNRNKANILHACRALEALQDETTLQTTTAH
jgi:hypothetical protein